MRNRGSNNATTNVISFIESLPLAIFQHPYVEAATPVSASISCQYLLTPTTRKNSPTHSTKANPSQSLHPPFLFPPPFHHLPYLGDHISHPPCDLYPIFPPFPPPINTNVPVISHPPLSDPSPLEMRYIASGLRPLMQEKALKIVITMQLEDEYIRLYKGPISNA